jgi:hypothetical protein
MMKDYGEHFDFLGIGMAKMGQVAKMPKMPNMQMPPTLNEDEKAAG